MRIFSLPLSLLLLLSPLFAQAATDRPNVIVIMADDIGFECYSGYGSEFYSTPNIDRLGATGAQFTQAYSQPICTPSRVKIMTGKYNFRNYAEFRVLDLSEPTFAKMVKANGYATTIAGKWQLSPENLDGPFQAGFDEYLLWHFTLGNGGNSEYPIFKHKGSRYKSPRLFLNSKLVSDQEGKYGPDTVTDYIVDYIKRKQDSPFLIYYPMMLVHDPFDPTPFSPDWESADPDREPREVFREMVTYMDKVIGRIVDTLDETGLRENTLIIVTGDNGTNRKITSPFPGRGDIAGGKGTMKDAGTRVAFVANWKGVIPEGTVIDKPISFADVLPTIGDATGSSIPEETDGISLMPLIRGEFDQARDWIFMSYSQNGLNKAPYRCFVRDTQWKLYADGSLFDVPNDWLEESPASGLEADAARQRLQPILDRIMSQAPKEHFEWGSN